MRCERGQVWVAAVLVLASAGWAQAPRQVEQAAPGASSGASMRPVRVTDKPVNQPAFAVPRLVRFSGTVKAAGGPPEGRVVGITFALYSEAEGGAPLWQEVQNVQLDAQGRYSVLLGSASQEGLPLDAFTEGEAHWLGVQVEGGKEQPRVLLVSVPYALKAADAETLGGKALSEFVLAKPGDTGVEGEASSGTEGSVKGPTSLPKYLATGNENFIAKFTSGSDASGQNLGNSIMFESGGNVGIGTTNPTRSLHISNGAPVIRLHDTNVPNNFWELQQSAFFFDTFGFLRYDSGVAVQDKSLFISPSGNVGLGTASPQRKLHVRSDTPVIRLEDTNLPNSFWELQQSAFFFDTFGFLRYENGVAVQSKSFVVTNAGNMGVGIANPVAKLQVVGDVRANSYQDLSGNPVASVAALVRGITLLVGCETCSPLTDADDQPTFYADVVGPMTITSVTCFSDAGSPTINLQRNDGTPANVLTPDLACSTSGATATGLNLVGGESTLQLNNTLDFVMVSAGGTAKRVTVVVRATTM